MGLFQGIAYNMRGLLLGLRTPRLLFLGLIRFILVAVFAGLAVGLILAYSQDWLGMIWAKPASHWIAWLWHLASWLLAALLSGLAVIVAYLATQILVSALIMEQMSRITEKMLTGRVQSPSQLGALSQAWQVIRQEIPRAVIPVALMTILVLLSWATPLGPVVTIIMSAAATTFLAWDSTDLTPARRMEDFGRRFRFFRRTLLFHIGFGLPFLIPLANILFLAFSPVGATLYYVETQAKDSDAGQATPR
jgi:CysZ protein